MTNDLQRPNAAHLEVISQAPDRDKYMEKQNGTSYWRHVVKSAVFVDFLYAILGFWLIINL